MLLHEITNELLQPYSVISLTDKPTLGLVLYVESLYNMVSSQCVHLPQIISGQRWGDSFWSADSSEIGTDGFINEQNWYSVRLHPNTDQVASQKTGVDTGSQLNICMDNQKWIL